MTTLRKNMNILLWSEIDKWTRTASLLRFPDILESWGLARVGDIVEQITAKIKVKSDGEYKLAGVKWYGEGVFHRETVKGKESSATWLYPLVPGALIYNRLFAWKESFAIVPEEFKGHYVSSEFPQFNINKKKLLTEYIYLFLNTTKAIRAVKSISVGSSAVSRNRFKEEDFLNFIIPIPPLSIQERIVEYWKKSKKHLTDTFNEVSSLRETAENYMLNILGVEVPSPKPVKGKMVQQWVQFERWDTFFYRQDFMELVSQLKQLKVVPFGDLVRVSSRPWKRSDFPNGKFRYIEISSVSKDHGIRSVKKVLIDNAPSRATTLVKEGDLIISTTRPYLGAFTIVDKLYDNCVCSSGFALVDYVNEKVINKNFLLAFLKSQAGLRQFERRMTGGLYPAIAKDELMKIKVPIVSMDMQKIILSKIQEIETIINEKNRSVLLLKKKTKIKIEDVILGLRSVEGI